MKLSKKITAGVVALALGTSAIVAPNAHALPAEFVSPPGLNIGYQSGCKNTVSHSSETGQQRRTYESQPTAGMVLGSLRTEDRENGKVEYLVWAKYVPLGERASRHAVLKFDIRNQGTKGISKPFDYEISPVKPGKYQVTGGISDGTASETVNVTKTQWPANSTGNLKLGESTIDNSEARMPWAQLGFTGTTEQTYAWKVTVPWDKSNRDVFNSAVRPVLTNKSEPWPIETDNCQPMLPSEKKTAAIIADGKEYKTAITVSNAKDDFKRLTGNVYSNGKLIDNAKVRVNAQGEVYVTLPKGSTGELDNRKPANVQVEIIANPREETNDLPYESYNSPQVLRVQNPQRSGTTDHNQKKFLGTVPIQKFAPSYPAEKSVAAGESVKIDLNAFNDKVRGKSIATKYEVKKSSSNLFTPTVDSKTGQLTVKADKNSPTGTTQSFEVTATYPDGSKDTLTTRVKVVAKPGPTATLAIPGPSDPSTPATSKPESSTPATSKPVTSAPETSKPAPSTTPRETVSVTTTATPTSGKPAPGGSTTTVTTTPAKNTETSTSESTGKVTTTVTTTTSPVVPTDEPQPNPTTTPNIGRGETNPTIIIQIPGLKPGTDLKDLKIEGLPEGWTYQIGDNGRIVIVPAPNATPGQRVDLTIKVPEGEGAKDVKFEVKVPGAEGQNGGTAVYVYFPGHTVNSGPTNNFDFPKDWKVDRVNDNVFIIAVPENGTKEGTITLPGGGTINVNVNVDGKGGTTVVPGGNGQSSAKGDAKCLEEMSSDALPFIWLAPLGILLAVGAPIVALFGNELGQSMAAVQGAFNRDFPNAGNGGNDRPQSNVAAQLQIEAARLQGAIGPELGQAAAIGLALTGLTALIGTILSYCLPNAEPPQSSKKLRAAFNKEGNGSSQSERGAKSAEAAN